MAIQFKLSLTPLLSHKHNLFCIFPAFLFRTFLLSALLAIVVPSVASADPLDWAALSKQLPSSTNAVLAIDAESMFKSDFAIRNNWRESHADSFDRNPTMLPPIASRFLLATELDTDFLDPTHEFAVMSTAVPIPFQEIRDQVEGNLDVFGEFRAIHTIHDNYVVQLDGDRIALIRNASRQWAAKQIRLAQDNIDAPIPELLARTINDVGVGNSQIAIAVYLGDAVSDQEIRAMANLSEVLQQAGVSADQCAKEMALIEGFVLSIHITDTIHGRVEMVFSEEPKALTEIAKPFMIELLSGAGAMLPEFRHWQSSKHADGFALNGELSIHGLRRVLSLLNVDPPQLETAAPEPKVATSVDPEITMARATTKYVERVTRLVDGVASGGKGNNLREQVLWTDRSAKTIARMSTKNVHPDAVKLGRKIARSMIEIVTTFQEAGQAAQSRVESETLPPIQWETVMLPYSSFVTPQGRFYRYRPYSHAHVNVAENSERSSEIVAKKIGNANARAEEILASIESDVMRMNGLIRSSAR